MNRSSLLIIAIILFFGSLLRLVRLDQFPPQLNRDEAALAVNGLFLSQQGMDEWGETWPIQFKSFGDYKLPGYIYLLSFLFRLQISDWIVRLPSALAGIFLCGIGPLFLGALKRGKLKQNTLFFLMISFALSPFAFFYSRMAWEANLGLFLMLSSLSLLFSKPNLKKDFLALLLYSFAVITYNSPLLLLPFFIILLPFYRGLKQYRKWLVPFCGLCFIFLSCIDIFNQNNSQKAGILFFNEPTVIAQYPEYRNQFPGFFKTILGNKYVYWMKIATDHFVRTFLPPFLIVKGGQHPWHTIPGYAHLYLTTYILFILGLIYAVRKIFINTHQASFYIVAVYLLLISPLPAIFTTDAPHATRSLFTFIMILIFSTLGFEAVQNFLTQVPVLRKKVPILIIGLLIFESLFYFHQYFSIWPSQYPPDFELGFSQAIQYTSTQHPEENISIITQNRYLYILTVWYMKLSANEVNETVFRVGPDHIGLYTVGRVGRYWFFKDTTEPRPENSVVFDWQVK